MEAGPAVTLGILQVDSVRDAFRARHGDYPAMFRALFMAAASGAVCFRDYDVRAGGLPKDVDEVDVWLITGSRDSVYDDLPWIPPLEGFVRAVHAARRPLVGICFGHQLVAQALGGETRPAARGWGVGVHESRLVGSRPWLPPSAETFALLCSHKDQVTRLPEGADLLATSDFCPVAAFTVGDHLLCFQGHPEFTAPYARELLEFRRELLGEDVYGAGVASLARGVDSVAVARWILAFSGAAARAVA